ncbi:hypothetical protein BC940DRAFT_300563 [Gongronella butleri]|nr:hypothetical protein BC940DRAFT_300563 [Gongronella butleri]
MRVSFVLSFCVSVVLGAPIAMQHQEASPLSVWSDPSELAWLNDVLQDDIITHYENMVDDVFSHHRENLLLWLAKANARPAELHALLTPQAKAILLHAPQEACLKQMPGMIAEQVRHLHHGVFQSIEPTLRRLMPEYLTIDVQQPAELPLQLNHLNQAMQDHVQGAVLAERLEHKVALRLFTCELDHAETDSPRPRTTSWYHRVVKSILPRQHRAKFLKELDDAGLIENGAKSADDDDELNNDDLDSPTLLQTFVDGLQDHITDEWQLRLPDLTQGLRDDLLD